MTQALAIIQDSLERLGVYSPGETITDADASRGLSVLNELIDEWGDEFLYVYSLLPTIINLVSGKATYTIGVTGTPDIVQTRPSRISMGPGQATATVSSVVSAIDVVSAVRWNAIATQGAVPGTPDTLYYDAQYPNGVLHLAPVPGAAGGTVVFTAWVPLNGFTSLSVPDVVLSQGGLETLVANLAIKLKTYFTQGVIDPTVASGAITGKQNLRHTNLLSRAMIGRTGVPAPPAR